MSAIIAHLQWCNILLEPLIVQVWTLGVHLLYGLAIIGSKLEVL